MKWPLNPYATGICGGIPGFNIQSLSVAPNANILEASTRKNFPVVANCDISP